MPLDLPVHFFKKNYEFSIYFFQGQELHKHHRTVSQLSYYNCFTSSIQPFPRRERFLATNKGASSPIRDDIPTIPDLDDFHDEQLNELAPRHS